MAEKHLNAIYALSSYKERHVATGGTILDQELSDRYFLMYAASLIHFVY